VKTCVTCGVELQRRRGEQPCRWEARRYCSVPCARHVQPGRVQTVKARRLPPVAVAPPTGWDDMAACKGMWSAFYPSVTGSQFHLYDQIRPVCAACPCRAECLEAALAEESPSERYGMWGGMTPSERGDEAKRRMRARLAFAQLRSVGA
jgi:hypothetical protein